MTARRRVADALCPYHADFAADFYWPGTRDGRRSQRCLDCAARGPVWALPYSWMTSAQRLTLSAYHEAAHAVVGLSLGMDLVQIVMDPLVAEDGRLLGAATEFRPGPVRVDHFCAMLWAGRQAEIALGEREGFSSRANRVDASASALSDLSQVRQAIEEACPSQLPTLGQRLATEVVEESWADIEELANFLFEHGTSPASILVGLTAGVTP